PRGEVPMVSNGKGPRSGVGCPDARTAARLPSPHDLAPWRRTRPPLWLPYSLASPSGTVLPLPNPRPWRPLEGPLPVSGIDPAAGSAAGKAEQIKPNLSPPRRTIPLQRPAREPEPTPRFGVAVRPGGRGELTLRCRLPARAVSSVSYVSCGGRQIRNEVFSVKAT